MNATQTGTSPQIQTRGWVPQPRGRGTVDIITSCMVTMFLCVWTSVCVNVPAPEYGKWDIFRDRWHMFCLGALGPEFVLMAAMGQWCSARASIRAFEASGYPQWTMRHALFAEMGGVVLQTPNWKPFPISAKQLHYLVTKGPLDDNKMATDEKYLDYPDQITVEAIKDRNKSDGLSRLITIVQIFWFTVNAIARPIQNLAMVNLELTTLSYILCTLGTAYFWAYKPMDVESRITLKCRFEISKILRDAGDAAKDIYRFTPLDFIDREEWVTSRLWKYYVNILHKMRVIYSHPKIRPAERFSSFKFSPLTKPMIVLILIFGSGYSLILVAAWNFYYPTQVEKLLWRICSLGSALTVVFGGILEAYFILFSASGNRILRSRSMLERTTATNEGILQHLEKGLRSVRNNCPDKDPAYDVPLHSILITTPLCAIYIVFRWYILVEDLVGLREVPATAFETVDWTRYLPHI